MLFNLIHFNLFGDLAGFLLLTTYIFSKHFHMFDLSKKERITEQRCSRNTPDNDKERILCMGRSVVVMRKG